MNRTDIVFGNDLFDFHDTNFVNPANSEILSNLIR